MSENSSPCNSWTKPNERWLSWFPEQWSDWQLASFHPGDQNFLQKFEREGEREKFANVKSWISMKKSYRKCVQWSTWKSSKCWKWKIDVPEMISNKPQYQKAFNFRKNMIERSFQNVEASNEVYWFFFSEEKFLSFESFNQWSLEDREWKQIFHETEIKIAIFLNL